MEAAELTCGGIRAEIWRAHGSGSEVSASGCSLVLRRNHSEDRQGSGCGGAAAVQRLGTAEQGERR